MHTLIFVEQFLKFARGRRGRRRWRDGLPGVHVRLQGDIEAKMLIKIPLCLPRARGEGEIRFFSDYTSAAIGSGYIRSTSDPNKLSDVAIFPGAPRLPEMAEMRAG